jgi:hypothetical protein
MALATSGTTATMAAEMAAVRAAIVNVRPLRDSPQQAVIPQYMPEYKNVFGFSLGLPFFTAWRLPQNCHRHPACRCPWSKQAQGHARVEGEK